MSPSASVTPTLKHNASTTHLSGIRNEPAPNWPDYIRWSSTFVLPRRTSRITIPTSRPWPTRNTATLTRRDYVGWSSTSVVPRPSTYNTTNSSSNRDVVGTLEGAVLFSHELRLSNDGERCVNQESEFHGRVRWGRGSPQKHVLGLLSVSG